MIYGDDKQLTELSCPTVNMLTAKKPKRICKTFRYESYPKVFNKYYFAFTYSLLLSIILFYYK